MGRRIGGCVMRDKVLAWCFCACLSLLPLSVSAETHPAAAGQALATAVKDNESDGLKSLVPLRWQHRLLLLVDPPSARESINHLEEHARRLAERDLLWFVVDGQSLHTNYPGRLDESFPVQLRETHGNGGPILLIGKDGGVKLRAEQLDLDAIFARIDSMPMRQREMRRQ